MWVVSGCVAARRVRQVGMIMKVFKALGTPTNEQWPGVTSLLDAAFVGEVPAWPPRPLTEVREGAACGACRDDDEDGDKQRQSARPCAVRAVRAVARCAAQLLPRLSDEPLAEDLLTHLWNYNPHRRLTAAAALRHPWFNDVQLPAAVATAPPPRLQPPQALTVNGGAGAASVATTGMAP